jgi:phosphate transport system substrate-binding protein
LEDGSSLLFPAFNLWIANFSQYYPNVHITTGSGGSGKGVSEAAAGTVNIGASDAFLTPAQVHANPGLLNIPLAISAQQINYNVNSAINAIRLNMSATILAEIYNGTITTWNDHRLAALQSPSVAAELPSTTIVPIHRFDSSGDTSIFTQYLSAGDHHWNTTIGFGTTVNWPSVPGSLSATGNSGMLTALSTTPGGIAYVGISYLNTANQLKFGYAHLQNRAGNFVDITAANIQAAVNARLSSVPANETASLIYAPGANSYPIVNFEYAIVKTTQPSATILSAVQTFLDWDIVYGNQGYYLLQVHFIALPSSVAQLSLTQIASLHT